MTEQIKLDEKIADYKRILTQDPKSMVFVPLADCYQKSGMLDDALETALKGTWELPDYTSGYIAVARVYALKQVPHKALAAFKKAIDLDPSCLDAYKGMARIYREQGNIDAAVKLLTNAVFLFPEESALKQMLESLSPSPVGNVPSTPVSDATPKPIKTATIAEIYIKQGLYSKALDVYRELYAKTQAPEVAQKIAEIETLAQGGGVKAVPAEPANEVVATPTPATAPSNEVRPLSGQTVLATLNGMLASIQSRRNRV